MLTAHKAAGGALDGLSSPGGRVLAFARMPRKPGGKRQPEATDDTPPSIADVPPPELAELLDLARFGKRFGSKVAAAIGGVVLGLAGAGWYLISMMHSVDTRMAAL